MAIGLKTKIKLTIEAVATKAGDLSTAKDEFKFERLWDFTSGAGADQANEIFHDRRTLSASGSEDLDLSGDLTNAFGETVSFTKVRAIIVYAVEGNTNNVEVGGTSATQFATPFGDASDVVTIRPGGVLMLVARDATAYAVSGSTDLLQIANSAGDTAVTYDVVVIGSTA